MKACVDCGDTKPLDEFSPFSRSKPESRLNHCKPCHNERNKRKRMANPERAREHQRRYRERHADKVRADRRAWNKTDHARAYRQRWFAENAAHTAEYQRGYSERTAEARRWAGILRRFGLTRENYDALMDAQGGACAVCRDDLAVVVVHIDHCHQSGRVRGLLCQRCNMALGLLRDNPASAANAAAYLTEAGA